MLVIYLKNKQTKTLNTLFSCSDLLVFFSEMAVQISALFVFMDVPKGKK